MMVAVIFSLNRAPRLSSQSYASPSSFQFPSYCSLYFRQPSVSLGSEVLIKKNSVIKQKYDRCLYKGRRALVSTARLMCTLSLPAMQGSAPVISAFPTSISRSSNIIKFAACAKIYVLYIHRVRETFKWRKMILYYSLRCLDSLLLWITRFWVMQWHQFGVAGGQLLHCVCSASEGRSDWCHICSSIAAPSHRI